MYIKFGQQTFRFSFWADDSLDAVNHVAGDADLFLSEIVVCFPIEHKQRDCVRIGFDVLGDVRVAELLNADSVHFEDAIAVAKSGVCGRRPDVDATDEERRAAVSGVDGKAEAAPIVARADGAKPGAMRVNLCWTFCVSNNTVNTRHS